MKIDKHYRIEEGTQVDLRDFEPSYTGKKIDRKEAEKQTAENAKRIEELQMMLYAEKKHSLLIVLQGMDGSGKDGTIRAVGNAMNLQGTRVVSFKAPTKEELSHHYLWRIRKETPKGPGEVVFFNRSHYEDVLVVRVKNLVPEEKWMPRYDEIKAFEKKLTDNGTHILKFFLNISKEEQLERFYDRLTDPAKQWKLSPSDFKERENWDAYQEAYQDAISKTSTENAPWYVIPANQKWFRDYVISQTVVNYLEALNMQPPAPSVDVNALLKQHYGVKPGSKVQDFKKLHLPKT